ncbi:MAG: DUF3781 domain-containing protein, partial [Bacilli bacterium]|nr:DUF3781 domain-containing protein [Bacilli bacterium]
MLLNYLKIYIIVKQTIVKNYILIIYYLIDKVHTTEMGIDRIKKNLKLDTDDVVEYCKNKVLDKNCNIYKQGKNW